MVEYEEKKTESSASSLLHSIKAGAVLLAPAAVGFLQPMYIENKNIFYQGLCTAITLPIVTAATYALSSKKGAAWAFATFMAAAGYSYSEGYYKKDLRVEIRRIEDESVKKHPYLKRMAEDAIHKEKENERRKKKWRRERGLREEPESLTDYINEFKEELR